MVECYECGDPKGRPVIYFHGAPGAASECSLFEEYALENHLSIIAFDRFSINKKATKDEYFESINQLIKQKVGDEKIDLIGFSLGAYVAVEMCQLLGSQVKNLHLISAAAPLSEGDFLSKMVSKPVFEMAKKRPSIFRKFVYFQSLMAKYTPSLLFKILFTNTAGEDGNLVKQPYFRQFLIQILHKSYLSGGFGFVRDVHQYLNWSDASIGEISAKTYIWQGEQDNWTPIEMAEYLANAIEGAELHRLPNLSHYSALYAAAPQICVLK